MKPNHTADPAIVADAPPVRPKRAQKAPAAGLAQNKSGAPTGNERPTTEGSDGRRPYILESSVLESDLRRQRDAAVSEISSIDAAIDDITRRRDRDILSIQERADVEIRARDVRANDLHRVIATISRALDLPSAAPDTPVSNDEISRHLDEARDHEA